VWRDLLVFEAAGFFAYDPQSEEVVDLDEDGPEADRATRDGAADFDEEPDRRHRAIGAAVVEVLVSARQRSRPYRDCLTIRVCPATVIAPLRFFSLPVYGAIA
jgi:hypothetical protein